MEDFESCFEHLSVRCNSWGDFIKAESAHESKHSEKSDNSSQNVPLLPRHDVHLYRFSPLEGRSLSLCKGCGGVFNPKEVLRHRGCTVTNNSYSGSHHHVHSKKKSKKSSIPLPPKFFTNEPTSTSTKVPPKPIITDVKVVIPLEDVKNIPLPISLLLKEKEKEREKELEKEKEKQKAAIEHVPNNLPSSSSSSKSKKSKKSSKTEIDPNAPCGALEGSGPCTCSNHRTHLKKLVKIQVINSEKKAVKEKETKSENFRENTILGPEADDPHLVPPAPIENKSKTDEILPILEIKEEEMPKILVDDQERISTTSNSNSILKTTLVDVKPKIEKTEAVENGFFVQTTSQECIPIVYLPISPAVQTQIDDVEPKVESPIPVENGFNFQPNPQEPMTRTIVYLPMSPVTPMQKSDGMESPQPAQSPPVRPQTVYLPIPEQLNVKLYKSHPKPAYLPTYGARKVGGAIVLSNQRLDMQRNDILAAINARNQTAAYSPYKTNSMHHRPNILKAKTNNKVHLKRQLSDKFGNDNNKHIRLGPDVNGFILHSDVSESAEAPSNSI